VRSQVQILSPGLETQQLFAINREELFLINGQWVAIETSIEIAVQFGEQNHAFQLVFSATCCSPSSCGVQIPTPLLSVQSMPKNRGFLGI
jgi:hypothetical protein